ncbi:tetratricopeptide repeat-containing sensor histidine kinase [Algoriphagus sp. D3-2-R+10]|uniref:tetratricopeptide repeat-containing sensor histidine kinase n=1 Tax=Algoriphagus aurantiacus TaxID=3103948 RepID=UPI002B39356F|nr:tetratricopeptide repeat-containing sensor histidine kinase [Algoriphagus sp. D3-2-R+10]MEB2775041.1 tetratricopeptide repeat-containing sensor histidine kinase [Algoriphagus sp. D3-2-R+10]
MIPYLLVWILTSILPIQKSQTDSLKMITEQTDNDSIKASSLYNLSKLYYTFDQDSAILFASEAVEISKKIGDQKMEANSLNIIGVSYLIKANYEKSLSTHFEALGIREAIQDSVGMIESTMNLGNIYYRLNAPDKAAIQYNESLKLAQKLNHERAMSLLYNNLGSYHLDRWLSFKEDNDFRKTKDFLENSKNLKEKLQDKRGLINTLLQLGELHYESGEKIKGIQMLTKSLEYSEELNDTEGRLSSLGTLSNYYRDDNSISKALEYAKQAYEIALATESNYQVAIAASRMSHLSALSQDYKNAYEYLQVKQASNDSIFNDSRQKIRDELEIQYEIEKKELENQKLIKEGELSDLTIRRKNELLVIAILVGLLFLGLAWYQRIINQKLRVAQSELERFNVKVQSQNQQIQQQSAELNKTNLDLNKANKFREKLFSIISHDLRTPFASLNNSLDLWQAGELSKEEMDYILSNIASNARTASILLSNLLKWTRTQMSSEQVENTDLSLAELISENQNLFAKQLNQKNLQLENHIPAELIITTDRERLNFIIRNILSNSIKFTPEGGVITIESDPLHPKAFMIRDTGIGMNQAQIDSLFDKKQYSSTGTNGEQGTGIGLMLCKDFADSIGATISVSSEAGKSTTFRIEL